VLIVSIIIATCVGAGVLQSQYARPTYVASSKIIVNKTNTIEGQPFIDQNSLAINFMFINTYKELIKTPPVLEQVVKLYPELHLTANALATKLKVTTVQGSQIMTLTIQDKSYEKASTIVNALATVFKNEIPKIMRIENVEILSEATPRNQPVPQETSLIYVLLISLIVSAVLAFLVAFLLESFDRTMKDNEDVEKLLGIPVLANVAEIDKKQLKAIKPVTTFKRVGEEKHVHAHS
jgi:capsular polysaccharide biosynthesis protein